MVLRIDEMPKVEVHVVHSSEAPTGACASVALRLGRPSPTPSSPPLANGCAFCPSLSAVRLEAWVESAIQRKLTTDLIRGWQLAFRLAGSYNLRSTYGSIMTTM